MNTINLKSLAEYYFDFGFNITCVNNYTTRFNIKDNNILKSPSHEWEHFCKIRQSKKVLSSYDWDSAVGIGLILGYDNLLALDIDGCVEEDFLYWVCDFLNIKHSYEWLIESGSNAGYHIIIYCPDRPDKAKTDLSSISRYEDLDFYFDPIDAYFPSLFWPPTWHEKFYNKKILLPYFSENYSLHSLFDKIEFRWINHLVLPPSLHRTGSKYRFINHYPKNPPIEVSFDLLVKLKDTICQTRSPDSSISTKYLVSKADDKGEDNNQGISSYQFKPHYLLFDLKTINKESVTTKNEDKSTIKEVSWIVVDKDFDYVLKRKGFSKSINHDTQYQSNKSIINLGEGLRSLMIDIAEVELLICHNFDSQSKVLIENFNQVGISTSSFQEKSHICTLKSYAPKVFDHGTGLFTFTHGKSIRDLYFFVLKKRCNELINSESSVVALNHTYQRLKHLPVEEQIQLNEKNR